MKNIPVEHTIPDAIWKGKLIKSNCSILYICPGMKVPSSSIS